MNKNLLVKNETYAYIYKILKNVMISNKYILLLDFFEKMYNEKNTSQNFYKSIQLMNYLNKKEYFRGRVEYKKALKDMTAMYIGVKIKNELERSFSKIFSN